MIIEDLYYDLLKQENSLKLKRKDNQDRIQEIDKFLESVMCDASDLKVFSPRNLEDMYKDRILEEKDEKNQLINDNDNYSQEIDKLDNACNQLYELMNQLDNKEQYTKVLDVQEKERQRIARELHDSSVQNLTHLVHSIELSSLYIDKDPIQAKLELAACSKNLKSTIEEIRNIIFDLRPMSFDDLGLKKCTENYINLMKDKYNDILFRYNIDDIPKSFSYSCSLMVFRIIQELVNNAIKHAEAKTITIKMSVTDDKYRIMIQDDGIGFQTNEVNKQTNHYGLSIIKERIKLLSASIQINSIENKGTTVTIELPVGE